MNAKKSQQLIEFLLIAPFLIIILGILTEFAYALNIQMTLIQGLKEVTSNIYSEISPGATTDSIKTQALSDLKTYLSNNNAPVESENNINLSYVTVSPQSAVFMARYTYYPGFTLPKMFFKIMPDQFEFLATVPVPTAFLGVNNYSSGVNSTTLDKVWSSTADFSDLDSFNSSKNGILKSGATARNAMLFLVPNSAAKALGYSNLYALVTWTGSIITIGAQTYNVNITTGKINTCSSTTCSATATNFIDYMAANNYYNVILINDSDAADIADLPTNWAYDSSMNPITVTTSTDLSGSNADGILKRALSIITAPSTVNGNYDNLSNTSYTVKHLGSMVFCIPTSINTSTIITGSARSVNYNFNG